MRYASIRSLDVSNGENVGMALFVQGCPFHCFNCFNPDTWDFSDGLEWTSDTKKEFLQLVDRPYIKRVSILGGEPLSYPNLDSVLDLVSEIKKRYSIIPQDIDDKNTNDNNILNKNSKEIRILSPDKSIWIYTGYVFEDIILGAESGDKEHLLRLQILKNVDVLIDGPYIDTQRDTLKWRGSKNQRVIDVKQSFLKKEIILWSD